MAEEMVSSDEVLVSEEMASKEMAPDAQVASEEVKAVTKRSRPRLPEIFYRLRTGSRLKVVKEYIASFEYSLKLETNFNMVAAPIFGHLRNSLYLWRWNEWLPILQ
ncbi:hypothetical protein M758_UG147600 [Ceratodon purpureus]|nr:hypothetical protein M758_UG147600 [Ceratodon purpureus]